MTGGTGSAGSGYGSTGCIICGRQNPHGLQAVFHRGAGGAWAEVVPPAHAQGFPGVLHGGIVAGLLDDAMWYTAYFEGIFTMTAELTVRYKKPVPVETALRVEGRVLARHHRLTELAARLTARDSGEVLAEAAGKFLAVPPEMRERLGGGDVVSEATR